MLLNRLRLWQRQADRLMWQCRSGLLLFVLLLVAWLTYSARVGSRDETIARTKESLAKQTQRSEKLQNDLDDQVAENRRLQGLVPKPPDNVKRMWSGWEKESPDYDSLMKKVWAYASDPKSDKATAMMVGGWARRVQECHVKFQPWDIPKPAAYYGLYQLYRDVRSEPWEDVRKQAFDQRLAALWGAAKTWLTWAEDDQLHFNDLYTRLAAVPDQNVKEFLHSWLEETNAQTVGRALNQAHAPLVGAAI